KRIFASIHHAERFALVGFTKAGASELVQLGFAITIQEAVPPDKLSLYLTDPNKMVQVPYKLIERMSPDTLSVMEFRSQLDADIAATIYNNRPLLGQDIPNTWSIALAREFDMTINRDLFNMNGVGGVLYEGKMIHHYTHRFNKPQYWVER